MPRSVCCLAQGLPHVGADQLWIEERNFCTLGLMFGMAHGGPPSWSVSTARCKARSSVVPPARAPPVVARSMNKGMLVRDPESGEALRVRRLTLKLKEPTRDGDTELHILSNVPVHRASAPHLARLYGKRWSIETAFFRDHHDAVVRDRHAGISQSSVVRLLLGVVAYNGVSLVKASLRSAHGRGGRRAGLRLLPIVGNSPHLRRHDDRDSRGPLGLSQELSAKQLAKVLRELASSVNYAYHKHPRGPKKKPPERTAYQNGRHVSTARLLAQK